MLPLIDAGGRLLAPAGAAIEGRLLRVSISHLVPAETTLVLRPQALEIRGVKVPLAAVPDNRYDLRQRTEILMPAAGEAGAGVFRFPGEEEGAWSGFSSQWRTVAAPNRN